MQKRLHFLVALLLLFSATVMAQVTTSSLNGKVVANGENVVGAVVTAIHEPSGTRYTATTNADGRYTIQGMRVGGPYTVTIDYIGYKKETRKNINLALGDPSVLNVDLKEDAQTIGEVTVTGQMGKGGYGASSNFSQRQIENAPTIDRNIYDVAKLSPLVNSNKFGGISIAGTNNRYNSFQIDGMVANDVFGLSSTGTNGGQTSANPISMDAIEQIQVVAAPFDIRQSGFTGGAINAITKSGTNKLTGTAFGYYTDENMYSRWSQYYDKKQKLTDETTQTYGFTLGGPIIKDKLFFFTSLEYKKHSYPASFYAGADGYFMTTATAEAMAKRYYDVTGIQESYAPRDINREGTSVLGRLDWNINDANHFSFRYQGNFSYDDNFAIGAKTFYFNGSGYRMKDKTHSFVGELTSHINDKLYNELRAGVTFVRDNRSTADSGPTIYINSSPSVNLGTEYSSGVNSLNQDIWTLEDNLSIYAGNHTFTLGTHNEYYNMKNGFIQAANGEYVYSSVDAFLNDENPSSFVYKYSDPDITGTREWQAPFKAGLFGIYAQDKWDMNTRFQLTYGLRVDAPFYFNHPSWNTTFNKTVDWAQAYNVSVGRRPATMLMASPRAGFRWYLDDSHSSLIRGGAGIFNGRAPFVWIENAWANTGIEMKGGTLYTNASSGTLAPKFGQYGNGDPMDALNSDKANAATPDIVTVDHKFRFPQAFRTDLAWEQKLPFGIKMTLEALYSRSLNAVWFENLALQPNGTVYAIPGVKNSATTYYNSNRSSQLSDGSGAYSVNSVINLKNTNKGHSYSFSAQLEKSFDFGLDLLASYTYGHSYSVNDGTSSVASSNWGYYYNVDPNQKTVGYSMFDMPHKVMVQASYNTRRYGAGRWQTHVSLVYNGFSGQRYSLTMGDNTSASFNGDYRTGNSLLYIPTKDELAKMNFVDITDKTGKVTTSADDARSAFESWIENDKYAKDHRGQYARRNSNMAPWENHFDFHLSQDFFYLKDRGSKVSLVFDILNVGNLINKHWGEFYSSAYNENILQVQSVSFDKTTKVATPSYTFLGYTPTLSDYSSRWHMQVGLRVTF
ncbi:MAG: carboxypeptidase regulatory-like domain-containing protein [Prevotella sp.]|jgi:hypothetical protein|uniref:Carboxypeptidase regulatory-like domain-containing protein n=1 Tax=Segatella cerevisiae TaxID=2053716 RepID=A0ABT1BVP0_9BACT|nr:carboxypeptidase regulatory-like domain-containing protein [Segatella cerevisiae]MCI1247265.1 carboxypeptidase regulatory-like domain-containing protein [Prevotella sp.]MCO6025155.1 carboxypeptidase regulatory-like domain-containing protein [Segatella cerevisiae]